MKTMPASDYRADPAISKSGLDQIAKSPAHYQAWRKEPDTQSKEMILGTAMHYSLLEPASFTDNVIVVDVGDRKTKTYKEAVLANPGKTIILADELTDIRGMTKACLEHPKVPPLLEGAKFEQSVFWKDKETGVECKARPDIINLEQSVIADLKTTSKSAAPKIFQKTCLDFRYHCQAAMYLNGTSQVVGRDFAHFVFIVVESFHPFAVAVYRADSFMLGVGQKTIKQDLHTYANCLAEDEWPGYPSEILDLSLPAWAL